MNVHTFTSEVWLPGSPAEIFEFFSDAHNLERLTPPWLRFEIVTPGPIHLQSGALIDYRIRFRGIPLRWRTRILDWEPPWRFTDEQIKGPYRQWLHEHTFQSQDGGTVCRDHVRYAVYGGSFVNRLFVRPDIKKIFAYRTERLLARFK
jgi:ligand-binding SRPBCC domain-containing protein